MLIIMLGMAKMKVKVYFYHLFILTVVMLLCFYLMYRDMKRIENNMVNLYQRCNNLDRLLNTADVPTNNTPDNNVDTELNAIYDKIENNMDNVDGDAAADDDNDEGLDDDGNEDEDNNVENENSETEDSENDNNENDSEEDDNDVKDLLHKVILVNDDNDDNDNDDNDDDDDDDDNDNDDDNTVNVKTVKEINTELTDDVTELLNSIENLKVDVDFSKLSKEELLTKTNNELKEYLKSKGKSTSGNKEQLVENILNLN